jgi:prepilin-type N-terminal cleavage/methylation domain-containing protein
MQTKSEQGFTLIELATVLIIIGIVIGFSVPNFVQYGRTHRLHGAAENMAAQFRLARQKALSTGIDQHFHISGFGVGYDYYVHPWTTSSIQYYSLPNGVDFAPPTYSTTFFMYGGGPPFNQPAGRASSSFTVKLTDGRGDTSTVSVQLSGLVTVY